MRNNKGRNLLRVMLLSICLIAFSNHVWAKDNAPTDDADEIMQTAKESLSIISQLVRVQQQHVNESLKLLLVETSKSIRQHEEGSKLIEELIGEVQVHTVPTTQKVAALNQNEVSIETTLARREQGLKDAQNLLGHLTDLENTRRLFEKVSKDRILAGKIAELIRSNNRTALGNLLKANTSTNTSSSTSPNDGSTAQIEVREAKDTNGLILVFRIYGLTQCLSTTLQCSGKSYSVTK